MHIIAACSGRAAAHTVSRENVSLRHWHAAQHPPRAPTFDERESTTLHARVFATEIDGLGNHGRAASTTRNAPRARTPVANDGSPAHTKGGMSHMNPGMTETTQPLSGQAPPDPSWSGYYRAGGLALIVAGLLFIAQLFLLVLGPKMPASGEAYLTYV